MQSAKKLIIASISGFFIGFAAGLVGVGGGEFRLPILVGVLGFSVAMAANINLLIGVVTVTVGLLRRIQTGFLFPTFDIILAMCFGSILGAYSGAWLTGKVKEKYLKIFLAIFLVMLGIKLITEPLTHLKTYFLPAFPLNITLALIFGILIGVVCGALGVAGGELRIPIFMYVFSLPIKSAGTASLLVSIPAVLSGAFKHIKMGHLNREGKIICIAMGVPAMIGAFLGASMLGIVSEDFLKILLGIILLAATVRVIKP
ncbi:MAG: sulfite exporter TauE/SafE family protein [Candidatus Thermoplasmatota archaeon]|nr:sulfite exporter TauE/SafE family protein [Candidatus Thermoplasmatota archaeon]